MLGDIGDKSAAPVLLKIFWDKEYKTSDRMQVGKVLSKIGDKSVVPALIKILQNKKSKESSRDIAAYVLGVMGDKSAIPVLINAMGNEKQKTPFSVWMALTKLTGMYFFIDDVAKWKLWWEKNKDNILKEDKKPDK